MRYLIPITFFILPVLAFAAGQDAGSDVSAVVVTQPATGGDGSLSDWNDWVCTSALGKMAAAFLLSVVTLGATRLRGIVTDRQGTAIVSLLALLGGVSSSMMSGGPMDPKLVETTLAVLLTAVGGYSVVKKLAFPSTTSTTGSQKGQGTASGEIERPLPLPPEAV